MLKILDKEGETVAVLKDEDNSPQLTDEGKEKQKKKESEDSEEGETE